MTVRRLTSAEYAYAIHDLTGTDINVGIDASSDAVGGEGFTNFGDVQFVQDQSVERYLEAAKLVADYAMIGAGPLAFSPTPAGPGSRSRRSIASTSSTPARASASSPARAAGRSASIATARRSTSPGTTSIASRLAIPRRPFAASRPRKASPAASPITSGPSSTRRRRSIRRARPSTAGSSCRRRPRRRGVDREGAQPAATRSTRR